MIIKRQQRFPIEMETEDLEAIRKVRQLVNELSRRMSEEDCEYISCYDNEYAITLREMMNCETTLDCLAEAEEMR